MKRILKGTGLFIFMTFFLSSSCPVNDDDDDDKTIGVEFEIYGTVRTRNSKTGEEFPCPPSLFEKSIRVEYGKAGYFGSEYYCSIDNKGNFSSDGQSVGWVNLYKEQPAEAKAFIHYVHYIPEGHEQFIGYDKLLWDDVYPSIDYGGSYRWKVFLNIVLVFDEQNQ